MADLIPVQEESDQEFTITLDNLNISLGLLWLDATECWYIQLKDSNKEVVQDYTKVLPEVPLIRHGEVDFGEYNIFVVARDRNDFTQTIGRNNFGIGKPFQLLYATIPEVNSVWNIFLEALNG